MLLTNKWFTAAGVTTLALGIGAAIAMVSVAYGVLLRPLPYPEVDRIVRLMERHPNQPPLRDFSFSNITYQAWNRERRTLGPLGFAEAGPETVGSDNPSRMIGATVSSSMFAILRVGPLLGRFFVEDDAREGAIPVVVLSEALWRERFAGNAGAIGQKMVINRTLHEIVGVTPPGFSFPERDVRFWTVSAVVPTMDANGRVQSMPLTAYARLADGVTAEQAAGEGMQIAKAQPWPGGLDPFWGDGPPTTVTVTPLAVQMTEAVRPVILFLLAGAACLLAIACANVANLLLSRGSAREREIGVMAALGATRGMLITQLLTEGLVIAVIGGAIGLAFAIAIVRALPAIAPADFPKLADIQVDWTMAAAATVISLISGVAAGVVPALRGGRLTLMNVLRTTGASASRQATRSRRALLVAETALAMMLVALATLAGRGFTRLMSIDPGYNAEHVLSAGLFLPADTPRADANQFAFALLEQLRGMPNVRAAGAGWMSPFGRSTAAQTFTLGAPGRALVSAASLVNVVTPGYAEALGLHLRAGRLLTAADLSSATMSVVVNEEFVRTFLGGVDPIDLTLGTILSRTAEARIVGVVNNVLRDGRQSKAEPELYLVPAHRFSFGGGQIKLVVRSDGDPTALAGTVGDLVRRLRKDAALDKVVPLAAELSDSVRTERLATRTMGSLAVLATLLAAIGLYGVLSYNVATRWREIGIRAALGADARDIVTLVVRDGLAVTAVGLLLGLGVAAAGGRLLQAALFGIEPLDPAAFMFAPLVLLVVALIACVIPALRATRIDPALALRAE
jgi:putative ABC transport system permease protein